MQEILFPEIAEEMKANIAGLKSQLEDLNQARKSKKAQIRQAEKSMRALTGSAGIANKQVAGRRKKEAVAA